ncbi:MAG TPA: hypothetical protein VJ694_04290, partial [Patescibacteria group bacterium]|nr:hypothetical protein [Patescibacteria group bacterium]
MELEKYWWHRLLKVVFVLATLLLAVTTFLLAYEPTPKLTSENTDIVSRLNDYTRLSLSENNVFGDFAQTDGRLGCEASDGGITELYEFGLEKDIYCNRLLLTKAADAASFFGEEEMQMKSFLEQKGRASAVCLMRKTVSCDSTEKIVKFRINEQVTFQKVYRGLETTSWVVGIWV